MTYFPLIVKSELFEKDREKKKSLLKVLISVILELQVMWSFTHTLIHFLSIKLLIYC